MFNSYHNLTYGLRNILSVDINQIRHLDLLVPLTEKGRYVANKVNSSGRA